MDIDKKKKLPLTGVKILDFGHTVMGPSCGMILADLGAEVIKVEPAPKGEPTRYLKGFGEGYFGYFNRNKKSISINLKTPDGLEVARKLIMSADVLIENFAPGTMERLKLGYDEISALNPELIFASLKGFLPGPYEDRLALDEVVQMMTGLAYMTGPSGRPLRAGTSVIDILGGVFAAMGVLLALKEKTETGGGQKVESALYESAVFLMGQHLCYSSQVDYDIPPMPERVSAWAVYDVFECGDGKNLFIGITTDSHWARFCKTVGWDGFLESPEFATNNLRIENKAKIQDALSNLALSNTSEEMAILCEEAKIPFAPILHPKDLFEDRHLRETDGLMATTLPNGTKTNLPRLPITMDGQRFDLRSDPPNVGEHSKGILDDIGISDSDITKLIENGIVHFGVENSNENNTEDLGV